MLALVGLGLFCSGIALAQQRIPNPYPAVNPAPAPVPPPPNAYPSPTPKVSEKAQEENEPIRGLRTYYAQAGIGFGIEEKSRNDPADSKPIGSARYTLRGTGLIGWGPLRTENLLFNIHYRYSQDWDTDFDQVSKFGSWIKGPKADTFLFPTNRLLRLHEIESDMRFVQPLFNFGLFSRLTWGLTGSQFFGGKDEYSETLVVAENFVPYFGFRYKRFYRGQIYMPLRTEINKEDELLNNTTYSFSTKGRGRLFSFGLNNAFFFRQIDSLLYADTFLSEYKYYSLQNDHTRRGGALSFDFPVVWALRAVPKFVYYIDDFSIQRVRIKNFVKGNAQEVNEPPILIGRKDTFLGYGLSLYYDLNSQERIYFEFDQEQSTSTIPEFNVSRRTLEFGYRWSLPKSVILVKRVGRFTDNSFAEEF